jgi:hypothetical protein
MKTDWCASPLPICSVHKVVLNTRIIGQPCIYIMQYSGGSSCVPIMFGCNPFAGMMVVPPKRQFGNMFINMHIKKAHLAGITAAFVLCVVFRIELGGVNYQS